MSTPLYSIVMPAYNEAGRIGPTLARYQEFFTRTCGDTYELIVVLNGCRDHTETIVRDFCARYPSVRYVNYAEPIGKGGAIAQGIAIARGDLIGYVDADCATSPQELYKLYTRLEGDASLSAAIASRALPESSVSAKTWQRRVMSASFNLWVNAWLGLGLGDTQCGAKVFRAAPLRRAMAAVTSATMVFDVDLLYALRRDGESIAEVPTVWVDQDCSTITKPVHTSLSMALSVVKVRFGNCHPLVKYSLRPLVTPLQKTLLGASYPYRYIQY